MGLYMGGGGYIRGGAYTWTAFWVRSNQVFNIVNYKRENKQKIIKRVQINKH